MMSYAEVFAFIVFVGMGLYISYLHGHLKASERKRLFLEMVIVDVIEGNVSIRKERDGFSIHKTERTVDGQA